MKKRLSTLLLLICCVFALSACGQTEKKMLVDINNSEDVQLVQNVALNVAEIAMAYSEPENLSILADMNEDELDNTSSYLMANSNGTIKMEGKAIYAAAESFATALENLGDITEKTGLETPDKWDITEDKAIVRYNLKGSLHNGSIEIIFDKNMRVSSATTNVEYSMGELMEKAGVNTAMGMGTVFVMLIVIAWIISLFQFIPKIQKAFAKKDNTEAKAVEQSVDNAIAGIIEREDSEEDDMELVAVIAAAIAASEGASSTDGFVVRSIKRIR